MACIMAHLATDLRRSDGRRDGSRQDKHGQGNETHEGSGVAVGLGPGRGWLVLGRGTTRRYAGDWGRGYLADCAIGQSSIVAQQG